MQDQKFGISEGNNGLWPSSVQVLDPNRRSSTIDPDGSSSLSLDESFPESSSPGDTSNIQVSCSGVRNPTTSLSPSNDRVDPRPLKDSAPAAREIFKILDSAIQQARTLDDVSFSEIIIFFLCRHWGFKVARQCAEVLGLSSRKSWLQELKSNSSMSHT